MLDFFTSQILFYLTVAFALFAPGYSLILAIFGKNKVLGTIERFVISAGLSIVSVNFIFFAYSRLGINITRLSTVIGIAFFSIACFVIYKIRCHPELDSGSNGRLYELLKPIRFRIKSGMTDEKLFNFSKNQFILILLLLFLTIFIKTAYLSDTVYPTATDMGHHMYWAKWMAENHQLPTYEGMPDFIIGEHIIFGVTALLSNADFLGAFPAILLLLINILSILAVFILTLRIFKQKNIAILILLFLGVLYAITSPQAKFVSGGVIGNIIGNFLMPLAFYLYYRAFEFLESDEEVSGWSKSFLSLAIFVTFGLFYTHHLTSFIFLFIFALLIMIFFTVNYREIREIFTKIIKVIISPQVIGIIILGLVFFFLVFTPNYVKTSAVDTAVGAPSKETRAGLSISNLRSTIGEARIALGFLGILVLALNFKRRNIGYAIVAAWATMIFIMSTQPHLLFINLPSNRIGNYLSYPIAILAAYSFYFVFGKGGSTSLMEVEPPRAFIPNNLIKLSFAVIISFVLIDGISDSANAFKNKTDLSPLAQTFDSSDYLARTTTDSDIILKDHNYITADSWMKLFFMRGYKYPLSRGYFKRYEDATKPREMCTLHMISNPNGKEAIACFDETKTNFIVINPQYDSAQFKKLKNFDQVYTNSGINIYYRNK